MPHSADVLILSAQHNESALRQALAPVGDRVRVSYARFDPDIPYDDLLKQHGAQIGVLDLSELADSPLTIIQQMEAQRAGGLVRVIFILATINMDIYQQSLMHGATDVLTWDTISRLPWIILRIQENLAQVRTQVAAAVRVSEEKFYKVFMASPDAIAIATLDEGRIMDVNESFLTEIGYTRDELIGTTSLQLWAEPEDRLRLIAALAETGHIRNVEIRYRRKGGEIRYALMSSELIEIDGQPCSISILRDITERKEMENNLRASQERYLGIVEDQEELICRFTPDFRLTFANRAYSRQYGLTPEEIIGKNVLDMIPESEHALLKLYIQRLGINQPTGTSEHQTILPDGTIRWQQWNDRAIFDAQGTIVEYQGVGRDITASKLAQDRLNFMHALSLATGTANDTDAALLVTMRLICEAQGWDYGEVWLLNEKRDVLRIGKPFFVQSEARASLERFREEIESYTFALDSGIPGRAWKNHAASWTEDVQRLTAAEFLRLEHAKQADIHGIVAIPVIDNDEVLAVMVFMAQRVLRRDEALLQLLTVSLQQIAPIIRRQQANDALIASEEKYRTLVENFDGVITIADADGRYLFANERAWAPFELSPAERQDQSAYDLFPKEVADTFVERVRGVMASGQIRTDVDDMQTGPDYRWFQSTIAPLRNPDGSIDRVITIAFDVTEAKQAEIALRESEAQLNRAQAIAHLGSWSLNFRTGETAWSDEFFRICGLDPNSAEASIRVAYERIHPEDRRRVLKALEHGQETGTLNETELRVVRPDGEVRWVVSQGEGTQSVDGKSQVLVGTLLDITERKRSELALERSAHRLATLHAIDQLILEAATIEQLASEALDTLLLMVPARRASVFRFDTEQRTGSTVAVRAAYGHTPPPRFESVPLDSPNVIDQEVVRTLETERYHLIQDVSAYPQKDRALLEAEGIHSVLSISLKHKETLLGGLHLHAAETGFFSDEFIQIACEVADQLAIGIHTSMLNERIRRYAAELEERVAQRTAEMRLQKTRIEAILQSSSDGILLVDETLIIREFNAAYCTMFGIRYSESRSVPLLDRIYPDDHDHLAEQMRRVLREDITTRCDVRGLRLDGVVIYAEIGMARVEQTNGDIPNVVCTIRDVTERKLAETRLRESEERYRTTISAMSEGIVVQDDTSAILVCNRAAEEILGLTADQMMGRTGMDPRWRAIHEDGTPFPGETHPGTVALRTGIPQYNAVMGVHKPDGTLVWILINAQPLQREGEDKPHAVVTTFTDITDRKAAQDALMQSELRYRSLFEQSNDGVFILSLSGDHQYVNQHAAEMFGYSVEELRRLSFRDIVVGDQVHSAKDVLQRLLAGEDIAPYERSVRRKDGSVFPVEINAELVRDANGKPLHIQSLMRNITDRKQTEIALRESEERFRQMEENIEQVLFIRAGDDKSIGYISPTYEQMFGKSCESLYADANSFLEAVHPDDIDFVREQALKPRYQKDGFSDFEYRIIRPDGETRWIWARTFPIRDEAGRLVKRVGIVEDITELRLAQAEMEHLTRRLQLAMEAGGIGIWDYDLISNKLVVDRKSLTNYGLDPVTFKGDEEDMATIWSQNIHPDDEERLSQEMTAAIVGNSVFDVEFRVMLPDGGLRYVKSNAVVLHDPVGKPLRMVGATLDVTQIREAEIALRSALEQEKELGELKSRFVSMASHEFRTPLATISATTETLLAYSDRLTGDQREERLNKIVSQVDYMKEIMEDVLQLARIQAGRVRYNPEVGDLDALLRDIIEEFNTHQEYRGRIIYEAASQPLRYHYDPRLMRHVISNLISNGLKYSSTDEHVSVRLQDVGDRITFCVVDQGIGIPDRDLRHLFEPFHRAQNVGTISGTGLGLSIAREAVEMHGGTIEVQSRINEGSTFTVSLPKPRRSE